MTTEKLGDHLMVIYGPPGTGKTTRVLELLESELEQGTQPDQIAFATFTVAARDEARDRAHEKFDLSPEELKWFKTLHATGYALLGMNDAKMLHAKLEREFCARFHYELTLDKSDKDDDQIGAPPRKTLDDDLRATYDWGRQRRMTPREAWSKGPYRVDIEGLELYVKRYKDFKHEHEVYDFGDMLEVGINQEPPPCRVAIIDEAQDLTPLQIATCYAWYGQCERVYVAGDDDQAIYLWAGADPAWMIALQKVASCYELLEQSYRVPSAVQEVANAIIHRNKRRVEKPYRSAKAGGRVLCTTQRKAIQAIVDYADDPRWTTFVLVRNRMFAQRFAKELMRQGVPFLSDIGSPGPLGKRKLCNAVLAADRFLKRGDLDGTDLRKILDYIPSGKYAPRGVKTKARGDKSERITKMQLILEYNLGALIERLAELGPAMALFKESSDTLQYLDLVLKRLGDLPAFPNATIMTMHASKGREANTVIVVSDMAKASWLEWQRDAEGENRVAYVAVTRAKDELLICDPETPSHYPYWEFVHEQREEVPF